jgi:peptidoglycan/xylan/chitin deacetylase (PgdA/CDA1 family)
MANRIAVLMYHELGVEGRPPCQSDPGYRRYIVPASAFQSQLAYLKSSGYAGISMGESLKGVHGRCVVLTFDDGCETDLKVAAPLLHDLDFRATFYVTVGFLGRPGYMTESEMRELSAAGFEIGCHSMTHPYLTELDDAGLYQEIVGAKEKLEQVLGCAVEHFSCPGGRFDERVVATVKEAGYATLANSEPRVYSSESDRYSIGRISVLCATSTSELERICEGRGLWRRVLGQQMRFAAQTLMGNRLYDNLRSSILSRSE